MKKMILLYLGLSTILSSCSTYYISTLASNEMEKNEKTGVFSMENDSVKISYDFYGEDAPIAITITNKLEEPIYVDWQRSALIVDGYATSYMGENMSINGRVDTYSSGYTSRRGGWNSSFGNGSINATASIPSGLTFVPPHASIAKTQLQISPTFNQHLQDSVYKRREIALADGYVSKIKIGSFTNENTPLNFSSYLTLYTINPDTEKPERMTFERRFYVTEVIKTGVDPHNISGKRGDTFYVRTVKGRGAAVVGAIVAAGAVSAVAEQLDDKTND